jgi:GT2 family glycosyltransferase
VQSKTAIVVTGMHRSGTSMVMSILKELGVCLGPDEDLLAPLPDNPAGFWENFSFVELGEKLLERGRAAWDYVPANGIWPRLTTEIVQDANNLVGRFNEAADLWGWKDPRTSLLLQFWQDRLVSQGTGMKLIVVLRHPLEVAHSLKARNGFSIRHGLHLWTEYNRALLAHLPAVPHLVTHYDLFLTESADRELARLIAFTGITPRDDQVQAAKEQVKAALKHERIERLEDNLAGVHPVAHQIYNEMCVRAGVRHVTAQVQQVVQKDVPEVSIIIPTLNGLPLTKACLASIETHTIVDHEVIVIDNGSTDGTVEFLRELGAAGKVIALSNKQNRGFAGAANQGLALARGRRVILLNNDTVVTEAWAARMLSIMATQPGCGLVGPVSNYVSGPQQIEGLGEMNNEEIDSFAEGWSLAHQGASVEVKRLVGFCLTIDRAVIDAIGGFDEQFFPGCFEDDDYGLRAMAAGFGLRIAREVFIYHVGGKAFESLGETSLQGALITNWERFKAKWGIPQDRPYGAPYAVSLSDDGEGLYLPLPLLQTKPKQVTVKFGGTKVPDEWPSITLCIIARDEAHNIADCIASFDDAPSHVVVVDTGSVDDTVAIAESLGAEVRHFEWCDDFAAAKNASIENVPGEWILWTDADDRVTELAVRQIKQAAASPFADAYFFKVISPVQQADGVGTVISTHLRMFRNGRGVQFEGAVHEDPTRTAIDAGLTLAKTDIEIQHLGYVTGKEALVRRAVRNRPILLGLIAREPSELEWRFHLAICCQVLGDVAGVVEQTRFVLAADNPRLRSVGELYRTHAMLITSLMNMGQPEEAFRALHRALQRFPNNRHLWTLIGLMMIDQGDGRSALDAFEKAEALPPFEFWQWPDETLSVYRQQAQAILQRAVRR